MKKKLIALIMLSIAFQNLVFASHSEAHGRKGSHRVGGRNSHGKGSHYVGGSSAGRSHRR
jgi:hypothetical protein